MAIFLVVIVLAYTTTRDSLERVPNEKRSIPNGHRMEQEEWLCNGHANLCDKPANQVLYATMHNSNNALLDGALVLPNHKWDLLSALKAGYRGINMDIGKCLGETKLLHASCLLKTGVPLHQILQEILTFLNENPFEVIIMPTELGGAFLVDEPTLADLEAEFEQVPGWKDKLYNHPGPGEPWPTLRELISTDKRILFFHYNGETCDPGMDCPPGLHPWFDYAMETRFSFTFCWDFNNKEQACEVTRGGNGTRDFFGVNVFVTPARIFASILQIHQKEFLKDHLLACMDENGGVMPNLVLVDYWKIGDVLEVVNEINAGL